MRRMSTDHDFWNAQRRRIYLPKDSINLNAGTLSPTPIPVMEALMRVREMQARAPSDFLWRQTPPLMARARTRLAEYVHCNPANLLLLPNVTHAINLAVQALSLERGAEILITDHEYGAMIYTWRRWAAERGWTIREAKLPYKTEDPVEIVAAIEAAIRPSTKALFFSHVLSTTGLVLRAAVAWRRSSMARTPREWCRWICKKSTLIFMAQIATSGSWRRWARDS